MKFHRKVSHNTKSGPRSKLNRAGTSRPSCHQSAGANLSDVVIKLTDISHLLQGKSFVCSASIHADDHVPVPSVHNPVASSSLPQSPGITQDLLWMKSKLNWAERQTLRLSPVPIPVELPDDPTILHSVGRLLRNKFKLPVNYLNESKESVAGTTAQQSHTVASAAAVSRRYRITRNKSLNRLQKIPRSSKNHALSPSVGASEKHISVKPLLEKLNSTSSQCVNENQVSDTPICGEANRSSRGIKCPATDVVEGYAIQNLQVDVTSSSSAAVKYPKKGKSGKHTERSSQSFLFGVASKNYLDIASSTDITKSPELAMNSASDKDQDTKIKEPMQSKPFLHNIAKLTKLCKRVSVQSASNAPKNIERDKKAIEKRVRFSLQADVPHPSKGANVHCGPDISNRVPILEQYTKLISSHCDALPTLDMSTGTLTGSDRNRLPQVRRVISNEKTESLKSRIPLNGDPNLVVVKSSHSGTVSKKRVYGRGARLRNTDCKPVRPKRVSRRSVTRMSNPVKVRTRKATGQKRPVADVECPVEMDQNLDVESECIVGSDITSITKEGALEDDELFQAMPRAIPVQDKHLLGRTVKLGKDCSVQSQGRLLGVGVGVNPEDETAERPDNSESLAVHLDTMCSPQRVDTCDIVIAKVSSISKETFENMDTSPEVPRPVSSISSEKRVSKRTLFKNKALAVTPEVTSNRSEVDDRPAHGDGSLPVSCQNGKENESVAINRACTVMDEDYLGAWQDKDGIQELSSNETSQSSTNFSSINTDADSRLPKGLTQEIPSSSIFDAAEEKMDLMPCPKSNVGTDGAVASSSVFTEAAHSKERDTELSESATIIECNEAKPILQTASTSVDLDVRTLLELFIKGVSKVKVNVPVPQEAEMVGVISKQVLVNLVDEKNDVQLDQPRLSPPTSSNETPSLANRKIPVSVPADVNQSSCISTTASPPQTVDREEEQISPNISDDEVDCQDEESSLHSTYSAPVKQPHDTLAPYESAEMSGTSEKNSEIPTLPDSSLLQTPSSSVFDFADDSPLAEHDKITHRINKSEETSPVDLYKTRLSLGLNVSVSNESVPRTVEYSDSISTVPYGNCESVDSSEDGSDNLNFENPLVAQQPQPKRQRVTKRVYPLMSGKEDNLTLRKTPNTYSRVHHASRRRKFCTVMSSKGEDVVSMDRNDMLLKHKGVKHSKTDRMVTTEDDTSGTKIDLSPAHCQEHYVTKLSPTELSQGECGPEIFDIDSNCDDASFVEETRSGSEHINLDNNLCCSPNPFLVTALVHSEFDDQELDISNSLSDRFDMIGQDNPSNISSVTAADDSPDDNTIRTHSSIPNLTQSLEFDVTDSTVLPLQPNAGNPNVSSPDHISSSVSLAHHSPVTSSALHKTIHLPSQSISTGDPTSHEPPITRTETEASDTAHSNSESSGDSCAIEEESMHRIKELSANHHICPEDLPAKPGHEDTLVGMKTHPSEDSQVRTETLDNSVVHDDESHNSTDDGVIADKYTSIEIVDSEKTNPVDIRNIPSQAGFQQCQSVSVDLSPPKLPVLKLIRKPDNRSITETSFIAGHGTQSTADVIGTQKNAMRSCKSRNRIMKGKWTIKSIPSSSDPNPYAHKKFQVARMCQVPPLSVSRPTEHTVMADKISDSCVSHCSSEAFIAVNLVPDVSASPFNDSTAQTTKANDLDISVPPSGHEFHEPNLKSDVTSTAICPAEKPIMPGQEEIQVESVCSDNSHRHLHTIGTPKPPCPDDDLTALASGFHMIEEENDDVGPTVEAGHKPEKQIASLKTISQAYHRPITRANAQKVDSGNSSTQTSKDNSVSVTKLKFRSTLCEAEVKYLVSVKVKLTDIMHKSPVSAGYGSTKPQGHDPAVPEPVPVPDGSWSDEVSVIRDNAEDHDVVESDDIALYENSPINIAKDRCKDPVSSPSSDLANLPSSDPVAVSADENMKCLDQQSSVESRTLLVVGVEDDKVILAHPRSPQYALQRNHVPAVTNAHIGSSSDTAVGNPWHVYHDRQVKNIRNFQIASLPSHNSDGSGGRLDGMSSIHVSQSEPLSTSNLNESALKNMDPSASTTNFDIFEESYPNQRSGSNESNSHQMMSAASVTPNDQQDGSVLHPEILPQTIDRRIHNRSKKTYKHRQLLQSQKQDRQEESHPRLSKLLNIHSSDKPKNDVWSISDSPVWQYDFSSFSRGLSYDTQSAPVCVNKYPPVTSDTVQSRFLESKEPTRRGPPDDTIDYIVHLVTSEGSCNQGMTSFGASSEIAHSGKAVTTANDIIWSGHDALIKNNVERTIQCNGPSGDNQHHLLDSNSPYLTGDILQAACIGILPGDQVLPAPKQNVSSDTPAHVFNQKCVGGELSIHTNNNMPASEDARVLVVPNSCYSSPKPLDLTYAQVADANVTVGIDTSTSLKPFSNGPDAIALYGTNSYSTLDASSMTHSSHDEAAITRPPASTTDVITESFDCDNSYVDTQQMDVAQSLITLSSAISQLDAGNEDSAGTGHVFIPPSCKTSVLHSVLSISDETHSVSSQSLTNHGFSAYGTSGSERKRRSARTKQPTLIEQITSLNRDGMVTTHLETPVPATFGMMNVHGMEENTSLPQMNGIEAPSIPSSNASSEDILNGELSMVPAYKWCPLCYAWIETDQVHLHKKTHRNLSLICKECCQLRNNRQAYKQHRDSQHDEILSVTISKDGLRHPPPVECIKCQNNYENDDQLKKHLEQKPRCSLATLHALQMRKAWSKSMQLEWEEWMNKYHISNECKSLVQNLGKEKIVTAHEYPLDDTHSRFKKVMSVDIPEREMFAEQFITGSEHVHHESEDSGVQNAMNNGGESLACEVLSTIGGIEDLYEEIVEMDSWSGSDGRDAVPRLIKVSCITEYVEPNIDSGLSMNIDNKSEDVSIHWNYCDICGAKFELLSALRDHQSSAHPRAGTECGYTCAVCNKRVKSLSGLKRHLKSKHEENLPPGRQKSEVKGQNGHSDKGNIPPNEHHSLSQKGCSSIDERNSHLNVISGDLSTNKLVESEVTTTSKQTDGHCCEKCGKVFKTSIGLSRHQLKHTSTEYFHSHRCRLCKTVCRTLAGWRRHVSHKHSPAETVPGIHRCGRCGCEFEHVDLLGKHTCPEQNDGSDQHPVGSFDDKMKEYYCRICDKWFQYKTGLIRHNTAVHRSKLKANISSPVSLPADLLNSSRYPELVQKLSDTSTLNINADRPAVKNQSSVNAMETAKVLSNLAGMMAPDDPVVAINIALPRESSCDASTPSSQPQEIIAAEHGQTVTSEDSMPSVSSVPAYDSLHSQQPINPDGSNTAAPSSDEIHGADHPMPDVNTLHPHSVASAPFKTVVASKPAGIMPSSVHALQCASHLSPLGRPISSTIPIVTSSAHEEVVGSSHTTGLTAAHIPDTDKTSSQGRQTSGDYGPQRTSVISVDGVGQVSQHAGATQPDNVTTTESFPPGDETQQAVSQLIDREHLVEEVVEEPCSADGQMFSAYQCGDCDKRFTNIEDIQQHMWQHD